MFAYLLSYLFIYLFIRLFISSAKKNLPSQAEKIQQKSTARSCNNTTVSHNSQRSNHANNNQQDDSMFNDDDDDDLDITEIDQALLEEKAPLSSQETEEKVDKMINHNNVAKTGAASTSQRYMFHCVITAVFETVLRISHLCIDNGL